MTSTNLPRSELSEKLAGWRGGHGPRVVLIHGVGLTADAWYAMIPELSSNFTIDAVDLPGHGNSAPLAVAAAPSLSDYTNAIADLLANGEDKPIVVGHSLGALIAMDLAIRHPKTVTTVVALNPIFRRTVAASLAVKARAEELASGDVADPTETLERWFGQSPGVYSDAYQICEKMLRTARPEGYATAYKVFAESNGPADDELRRFKPALLCMTGDDEPNSTPAMSKALAKLAPNGQASIIDGARHMMPITHAEAVNRQILQFVRSGSLLNG